MRCFAVPTTSQAPVTVLTEDPRHRPHRSHKGGNPAGHGSGPSGQAREKGWLEARNGTDLLATHQGIQSHSQHLPLTGECKVPRPHCSIPLASQTRHFSSRTRLFKFSVPTHWTLPRDMCFENKSRIPQPQIPQLYQTAVTAMSSHQPLAETGPTTGITRGAPRHCAP